MYQTAWYLRYTKDLQVIFEREAHIEQMFGNSPFGKMSWFWFRTCGPLPFFVGTSDNRLQASPDGKSILNAWILEGWHSVECTLLGTNIPPMFEDDFPFHFRWDM